MNKRLFELPNRETSQDIVRMQNPHSLPFVMNFPAKALITVL